jgi:hypothetical protein
MHEEGIKGYRYDIFIAVSYKAACIEEPDNTNGYRRLLEELTASFEDSRLRVYLAPREERWGESRPPRDIGIRKDFLALQDASTFILFLDSNESDGALVELGAALAFRKHVWILRRRSERLPSYLMGLLKLRLAKMREVNTEDDASKVVQEIKSRAQREMGGEDFDTGRS